MVNHTEILQACPAKAWAKHRFTSELPLVNGNKIVIRYDIPENVEQATIFSQEMVAQQFGSMMGESALDEDVCSAIADTLNLKITLTYKTVALHLKLVAECLNALAQERYLLAFLMLRSLTAQLTAYAGELWVYEWPEWIGLVEQYINERADPITRQIIQKML